jgi:hypothetical protein
VFCAAVRLDGSDGVSAHETTNTPTADNETRTTDERTDGCKRISASGKSRIF